MAGWDQEWIKTAERICHDEFERKYKGKFTSEVSNVAAPLQSIVKVV